MHTYGTRLQVRAGVGHLAIVDGDVVDVTNKNRQVSFRVDEEGGGGWRRAAGGRGGRRRQKWADLWVGVGGSRLVAADGGVYLQWQDGSLRPGALLY